MVYRACTEDYEYILKHVVNYDLVSDVEQEGTIDEEQEKSLLKSIAGLPKAVVQSVTGEGAEIEFPEVREIANMGGEAPGLVEAFLPNLLLRHRILSILQCSFHFF